MNRRTRQQPTPPSPVGTKVNVHELLVSNKVLSAVNLRSRKTRNLLYILLYAENPNHWAFQEKYRRQLFHDSREAEMLIDKIKEYGAEQIRKDLETQERIQKEKSTTRKDE